MVVCVFGGVFSDGFSTKNINKSIRAIIIQILEIIIRFTFKRFTVVAAFALHNSQKQAGQKVTDSGNSSLQKGQRLVDIYNSKYVLRKCNVNMFYSTRLAVILSILCCQQIVLWKSTDIIKLKRKSVMK